MVKTWLIGSLVNPFIQGAIWTDAINSASLFLFFCEITLIFLSK
ncbi:hypothetical protein CHCC20441_0562 [Bacillus licheniformis]|uniref:Uncharacterized protein n=1 Tax=Bacillus licheniformis TaxID=1402 RepID=A0A8B5YIG0_BACLI|nr:hypothetical protein B4090_3299 [Bacillus licheniformis]OLG11690.1 hypothetical protein B4123_1873 [Bacillus paralicheniformis]TWN15616.1 hypothetical protein CHCC14564_0181 [Bacillus licheniformis LMG 17339]KYC78988.1 hypothetical protein B4092_3287 [Bacillus licheniformis]KYC80169.1 hypothetical protein B4091_3566 [Bacillus licheniformis]